MSCFDETSKCEIECLFDHWEAVAAPVQDKVFLEHSHPTKAKELRMAEMKREEKQEEF